MKKIRELKIPIISFLLAGSATIIIFAVLGIHPFGDKSLLFEDLYIQYIEFFAYLRKILLGEASAVYSFSE